MLPQLQCGQCGYQGCKPYAQALAQSQAGPNLCKPGGSFTASKLASFLGLDEVQAIDEPSPHVAVIDPERCVGCYKCIEACPVDAIAGAHGQLHAVMTDHCTGCKLCVDPCPVDCIAIEPSSGSGDGQLVIGGLNDDEAHNAASRLRARYQAKLARPPLRAAHGAALSDPAQLAKKALRKATRAKSEKGQIGPKK